MRKTIIIAISAILMAGAVILGIVYRGDETAEHPSLAFPEYNDKIVLSDALLANRLSPGMRTNTGLSDSVIQGQIIDAEIIYIPFATGTPLDDKIADMQPDGQLPMRPLTRYTVRVERRLFGDKTEDVIEWVVRGTYESEVTKPGEDERVVLFLCKTPLGHYLAVADEHSIFTVDENGRLYSFSNTRELSAFDGKPVSALIDEIERTAKDLERNPLGQ